MTFKEFLQLPVTVGEFRGMLRTSYVRYIWNSEGLKQAKQMLNGFFGGWLSECKPTSLEQEKARNYINIFSRSEA